METTLASTDNETHPDPYKMEAGTYKSFLLFLVYYANPSLVVIGVLGNLVSLYVFFKAEMRDQSSSVYVAAVLIADTGSLMSILPAYLALHGIQLMNVNGWCQLIVYLNYVCSFLSVWYMVCITTENYITICHPLLIGSFCTVLRARVVVVSLAIASLLMYAIVIVTVITRSDSQCVHDWSTTTIVVSIIDSIVTLLLPTAVFAVVLTLIACRAIKNFRKRLQNRALPSPTNVIQCPQLRIMKLLFIMSVLNFMVSTPSHVTRLYVLVCTLFQMYHYLTHSVQQVLVILLTMSYISFAFKFFIFLALSKNFRDCLCCLFKSDNNNSRNRGKYTQSSLSRA